MPIDIAVMTLGTPIQGNHPPAPQLPPLQSIIALAEGTNSADIVIPGDKSGVVLSCRPTVAVRIAALKAGEDNAFLTGVAGDPDAVNSAVICEANQTRLLSLRPGKWRVRTALA